MESDVCYFRRRADEEFVAAGRAACDNSRDAHFQMGERYAQLAAAIEAVDEQIGPPPKGFDFNKRGAVPQPASAAASPLAAALPLSPQATG